MKPLTRSSESSPPLPYAGLRVVEFSHMVMGPTCGMILADMGAEVIKVEPIGGHKRGDATRELLGSGAGFFPMFNRNKKSVALNLDTPEGLSAAKRLVSSADVVGENFKAGAMARLGLDYAHLKSEHPRLIYVSHRGFLPGPYDNRTALDEVVQMMGGMAYMTGRPGDPLRAGSSVNDIMGGMFGAMGVMAALAEREKTGLGQEIQSALFENNVLLMAQHMMQFAVTGHPAAPMPSRVSAWGVYDVFDFLNGEQVFLAVVSDTAWGVFCRAFGFEDLLVDERLVSNNSRVKAREWMMPMLRERLGGLSAQEVSDRFEKHGLPFAPITKPQDLFDDPHLLSSGGLAPITLASGQSTCVPLLPITLGGQRLGVRMSAPALGEHNEDVLRGLGYSAKEIKALSGKTSRSP